MSQGRIVWSDEKGDLRKSKSDPATVEKSVDEAILVLALRRLTSGKGRTVIEITRLPQNKKWCQDLAATLKKRLGVGGSYKNEMIEIHHSDLSKVSDLLEQQKLRWKKIGG